MEQKGLVVVGSERKNSGLIYLALIGAMALGVLLYLFISPNPTEPLPAAVVEPVVNPIQEALPSTPIIAENPVEAAPPKPQFPPPPPAIEPKHTHYHIKVKDVTAVPVPESAAKRVTIVCTFDDTSKNEEILSLLMYPDIHAFRTDAGYPLEMKPVVVELGSHLRKRHTGEFRMELLVPEKARTLEFLDANIGVVWEKSTAMVRFDDPANARDVAQSHGDFKFRLLELFHERSEVKARISISTPALRPDEPRIWHLSYLRAYLLLPQGPALEARGSSLGKESMFFFRYQGTHPFKTLELKFVDRIEVEQYPFRLANIALPTPDEMRQQIAIKPQLKFESQDLLFKLVSLKSLNTPRGYEFQPTINVEWAPEKNIAACVFDLHDIQARDNTGLELKRLGEPLKSTSTTPYRVKTSQFQMTMPALAAETLNYLRGTFEAFVVSEFDEVNIPAPSSEEIREVDQQKGNAKIVSVERTHNSLIVQSDVVMPNGVDAKWHGWMVKSSIVDEKGNIKVPNGTFNKSIHGKTTRFLRTDTYAIDHFQPHRIKLSVVKSGTAEIVPFEFKDVPLRKK